MMKIWVGATLLMSILRTIDAFRFPSPFGTLFPTKEQAISVVSAPKAAPAPLKRQLLQSISGTNNGKSATPEQQANVLSLVRQLETEFPAPSNLLTDTSVAKAILDGTWYLQYTSPSVVGDADAFPDAWKPQVADEGDSKIPTTQFNAQGSVSAAGIKVDTSNRIVKQIIDVDASRIVNDIGLDWGQIKVAGKFRQSPNVPNRALVAFDTAIFDVNKGPTINLGFLFSALALVRRTEDNGWLETTYIDDDIRVGRGNKGTMFVLTRDFAAVSP
ncbi:hypothetical protein MPSEU_000190500 [Mayamaea pseudoterrestris]|nr:hypothetical protein MPSEU_000190500 [Mayamaea pseudoterrestris]